jgi:branched-subunit amino acid permease
VIICFAIAVLTHLTATGKVSGLGRWFTPFMLVLLLAPTAMFIWESLKKAK